MLLSLQIDMESPKLSYLEELLLRSPLSGLHARVSLGWLIFPKWPFFLVSCDVEPPKETPWKGKPNTSPGHGPTGACPSDFVPVRLDHRKGVQLMAFDLSTQCVPGCRSPQNGLGSGETKGEAPILGFPRSQTNPYSEQPQLCMFNPRAQFVDVSRKWVGESWDSKSLCQLPVTHKREHGNLIYSSSPSCGKLRALPWLLRDI